MAGARVPDTGVFLAGEPLYVAGWIGPPPETGRTGVLDDCLRDDLGLAYALDVEHRD